MKYLNHNPYDYNSVSLKRQKAKEEILSEEAAACKKAYEKVGSFLGVLTNPQWNKHHKMIKVIAQWAKEDSKSDSQDDLVKDLEKKEKLVQKVNDDKLVDFYIASQLQDKPEEKEDLFSYEFKSNIKSKVNDLTLPTKDSLVNQSTYVTIGRALGVEDNAGWNKDYEKIFLITEWAKERSGLKKPQELLDWIKEHAKGVRGFGTRMIDDLYNRIRSIKDENNQDLLNI